MSNETAGSISYQDKPWLKHYDEGVPATIDYKEILLTQYLDSAARDFPNKTALIFQGYKMKYRELKDMVDRFATCLASFGVKQGDSVSIHLPNIIPCVVAYYAILKLGAKVVMNNPLYSMPELEHQFNDSGSKVLITLDLLANYVIDLRPKTGIKQIVVTSIGDYLPFPKNILFPLVGKKKGLAADVVEADEVYRWKDLIARFKPEPPEVKVAFDDIAQLQYTGGTTGVSKGVMLTHANLSKQVQQIDSWDPSIKRGTDEIILGALPFFHVFGLSCVMNLSISKGWANVLVPRPQPPQLIEAIKAFKPTLGPLVPTMFIGILNHPDFGKLDLTSFKSFFSGSAPLPVEVFNEFINRTGGKISEGFGMTESSPVTHSNPFNGLQKIGSIGIPYPDTECRIASIEDDTRDMPVGETGELLIRGPQVMKGYWNKPEETEKTLKGGWLHTGDIAKMDEDGYFFIVDRIKDMILSGGYNVYPRDIDEVLFEHPKVLEACSIGVPHPERGEQIKVFVVLNPGETATEKEIIDYCKDKLAKYKWPTMVEFRDQLPKSNVGKVLRKILREEELKKS